MIGVTAWCLLATQQQDWPRWLKLIHSSGYEGIELHIESSPWPITPGIKVEQLSWLLKAIENANLTITGLSTMLHINTPITSADPETQGKALEIVYNMIDLASAVGGKHISIAPGGRDACWQDALPVITQLNTVAKNKGGRLLLENVWYSFSRDMEQLWNLVCAVDDSNTGICLDIGNALPYGDIDAWIGKFSGHIGKVHISDVVCGCPNVTCPVGEGKVDWAVIAQELERIHFSSDCTLELFPKHGRSMPRELIRSRQFIKKYFV